MHQGDNMGPDLFLINDFASIPNAFLSLDSQIVYWSSVLCKKTEQFVWYVSPTEKDKGSYVLYINHRFIGMAQSRKEKQERMNSRKLILNALLYV